MTWRAVRRLQWSLLALVASFAIWWGGAELPFMTPTFRFLAATAILGGTLLFSVAKSAGGGSRRAFLDMQGELELQALERDFQDLLRSGLADQGAGWWHRLKGFDRYDRPWYLMIGPAKSGKTTLVRNLRLHPVSTAHASGRVGCGWWFGDAAVVGDVASRYGVHTDSASTEHMAWQALVDLLHRTRPRRPLDGVLVAICLSDLLDSRTADRTDWADAICLRISEAERRFGMRLPVYLVLTKLDRLPGFTESFAHLDRDAVRQAWGTVFPLDDKDAADPATAVSGAIGQLLARLNDKAVALMLQDPDERTPPTILRFPPALEGTRAAVASFAANAFGRDTRGHQPLLRGVFLTSAAQTDDEGTATRQSRAYFAGHLLPRIGQSEGALFLRARAKDIRRLWRNAGVWAVSAAVCLSSLVLMLQYDHHERAALDVALSLAKDNALKFARLPDPRTTTLPQILSVAESWARLPTLFREADVPEWQSVLFRRPIEQHIHDQLVQVAVRMVDDLLFPVLVANLERHLHSDTADLAYLRSTLNVYDMITGVQPMDADVISRWLEQEAATLDGPERDTLRHHVAILVDSHPMPYRRDTVLVAAVNRRLISTGTDDGRPAAISAPAVNQGR
jgi:type VI secretion system protein ImpL